MPSIPIWLARLWWMGGLVGVVVSLLGGILGWFLVGAVQSAALDSLEATADVVELASETVVAVDGVFGDVVAALGTTEQALEEAGRSLSGIGVVTQEVSVLVGSEVPVQIESVLAAFPPLVDTARVVDRTMRALSLVGVEYDPEQPLDEALQEISNSLGPLPERLRGQREGLSTAADDLVVLSLSLEALSEDVATLTARLDETALLVSGYEDAALQAALTLEDLRSDLALQGALARVGVSVLAVALAVACSVPLWLGRRALAVGDEPQRGERSP